MGAATTCREEGAVNTETPTKSQELRAFLFLTVVMVPVITGLVIATYGFAVWIFQAIVGPPGS